MSELLLVLVGLRSLALALPLSSDVKAQLNPVGVTEARFVGIVTIDGSPAAREAADYTTVRVQVEALIDGKVCSNGLVLPPGPAVNRYYISVESEAIVAGCARPGDRITFRVDGRLANETAVWQAQSLHSLDLTVGSAIPRHGRR